MLMQNLTRAHKRHNLRVYDIKGSQFNRSALEEHKVDSKDVLKLLEITLKDKDFMEIEGKVEIAQSVAA